ncbi:MAG TPA: LptF/LptG family permease [Gemmatimonadales bacterium]|nr:LptF/LptG family permease [Gemmatimonadales bacterium]
MRLITRHILRALAAPFFWGVIALTGLLLLNQLAPLIDKFGGRGLAPEVIIEAMVLALPALFTLTIPMSVLVATLYAYSTLAADLEMVAMYANGLSVWRMVRPALVAVLPVMAINFLIFDQVVPLSNSRYKTLQLLVSNTTPTLQLRPDELNPLGNSGYVIRAHDIRQESGWLTDVTIYDLLGLTERRTIHADSGRMVHAETSGDLLLTLYDGEALGFSLAEPTRVEQTTFRVNVIRLDDVEKSFARAQGVAERGDREKSGCALQDGITESQWRHQRAVEQLERLTRRDLRNLAGLPPLPPPPAQTMPAFPSRCTGPWGGSVQHFLEKLLLPGTLEAQEPVRPPPPQDSVNVHDSTIAQDSVPLRGMARDSLRSRDSLKRLGVTLMEQETPAPPLDQGIERPLMPAETTFVPPPAFLVDPQGVVAPRADGLVASISEVIGARLTAQEALSTTRKYSVEYHKKFAIPLASLCFVLVGVALALKFPRSGIGLVIGGSLIIFLIFYILLIGGESLADDGKISPEFAMYAPVVFMAVLGLISVALANREMGTTRSASIVEWFGSLIPRRRPRVPRP